MSWETFPFAPVEVFHRSESHALFSRHFTVGDWNWIVEPPTGELEAEVKIRYPGQSNFPAGWFSRCTAPKRRDNPRPE